MYKLLSKLFGIFKPKGPIEQLATEVPNGKAPLVIEIDYQPAVISALTVDAAKILEKNSGGEVVINTTGEGERSGVRFNSIRSKLCKTWKVSRIVLLNSRPKSATGEN